MYDCEPSDPDEYDDLRAEQRHQRRMARRLSRLPPGHPDEDEFYEEEDDDTERTIDAGD